MELRVQGVWGYLVLFKDILALRSYDVEPNGELHIPWDSVYGYGENISS